MKSKNQLPFVFLLALGVVVLFASCEKPIDPPAQSISFEQAQEIQNEFLETRSPILREGLGFDDRRDFWFSLDTLKKYIEYVEQEGRKQGHKELGIRIYYAAYTEPQGNDQYPYSTVVLVPTGRSYGAQKGFFPMPPNNQNLDSINALNYGNAGQPPNDL